jgi:broad specificity phosphatase PhoE
MTKYLILVKHSLPKVEENLPANKWKLSSEGQARAHRLSEQLPRFQPELIFSSNEPKAKETAEIIAESHQLELCIVADLHEHDRRNIPYLPQDEFQVSVREFFEKPDARVFGSETANEAHKRFSGAVHGILNDHMHKTIAIVAHGTVISLFVSRLTGIADLYLWEELGLPSFVVLDMQSNALVAKENII